MMERTLPTPGAGETTADEVNLAVAASPSAVSPAGESIRLAQGLFGFAALCLLWFSLHIVRQPVPWLLGIVPDDAFYYLKVAQNIAQSGVSTFDGINPTNGYHPAWMLLMVFCAKLFPTRTGLLSASLMTGFAFHFATSLLLVKIFSRLFGRAWAWLGGALWMLNSWPLLLVLQCVEASFYLFALALLVLTYSVRVAPYLHAERPSLPPLRSLAWIGACLGLTVLGRTEGLLLAVVLGAYIALVAYKTVSPRPSFVSLLRAIGVLGGVCLLVFLPWLLYSRLQVGTFTQDSGAMKMLWARQEHLVPGMRLTDLQTTFVSNWLFVVAHLTTGMGRMPTVIAFALFVLMAVPVGVAWQRKAPEFKALSTWLLAGILVSSAVYGFLFTDRQVWYTAQPAISLFLVGYAALVLLVTGRPEMREKLSYPRVAGVLGLLTFAIFARFALKTPVYYKWQPDYYLSEPAFEARMPVGARIGCFNAGIPGYFGNRTVVNLDGLVNHAVLPYYRSHTFDRYLADQQIAFIADEDSGLERASQFSAAPIVVANRHSGVNGDQKTSAASVILTPLDQVALHSWIAPTRWLWRVDTKLAQKVSRK